jgi:hypothetical protein
MSEIRRELVAADMGDERYECPLCLDYVFEGDICSCSTWSEDELREVVNFYDNLRKS